MMRRILVFIFLLLNSHQIIAIENALESNTKDTISLSSVEHKFPKNFIYFEFGGTTNYLSINYERSLFSFGKNDFSLRISGFYLPIAMSTYKYYSFIINFKYFLTNKFFLNSGAGMVRWHYNTYSISPSNEKDYYYAFTFGVGYMPTKNLLLKLSITPKYGHVFNNRYTNRVWLGTSIGLCF